MRALKVSMGAAALCLLLVYVGRAQPLDLVKPASEADLTPAQSEMLADIRRLPTTADAQVIAINLTALNQERDLQVEAQNTTFVIKSLSRTVSDTGVKWVGQVSDFPQGTTVFIVHDGHVTGTIQAEDSLYRIRPLGGATHALIRVDPNKFPADHVGNR